MSDREEPTTDRLKRPREASFSPAMVASLLSAVLAGGGGSFATSWSVSGTMREGQIRLEASISALAAEVKRGNETAMAAVAQLQFDGRARDERIRQLELWRERVDAKLPAPPR